MIKRTWFTGGALIAVGALALAVGCFFISRQIDGGFFMGLFQGAAAALVVVAIFATVMMLRARSAGPAAASRGPWLPSRDGRDP